LSANNSEGTHDEPALSVLELTLLRNLKQTRKGKELSDMTNVDKKIVSEVLDRLCDEGYVGEHTQVTEKGFNLLNQPSVRVREEPRGQLSPLELLLLRNVHPWNKDKELSRLANVDLATVSDKLDKLYDEDYITEKHMLTEKGFDTLHRDSEKDVSRPPQLQPHDVASRESALPNATKTIVIQREIVKVPCKYCGALNEMATTKTCSNCGAVLK
jgi:DNA-binding MarR family transcriptional regulator